MSDSENEIGKVADTGDPIPATEKTEPESLKGRILGIHWNGTNGLVHKSYGIVSFEDQAMIVLIGRDSVDENGNASTMFDQTIPRDRIIEYL